jgi:hypothetical protein
MGIVCVSVFVGLIAFHFALAWRLGGQPSGIKAATQMWLLSCITALLWLLLAFLVFLMDFGNSTIPPWWDTYMATLGLYQRLECPIPESLRVPGSWSDNACSTYTFLVMAAGLFVAALPVVTLRNRQYVRGQRSHA